MIKLVVAGESSRETVPGDLVHRLPDGLVSVKINPETGLRTDPADPDGIFEIFRQEHVPAYEGVIPTTEETEATQDIF